MRVSTKACVVGSVLAALVATAEAQPVALQPFDSGKVIVSLPSGWKVSADSASGAIAAQQDPSRKDEAVVIVMVQASTTVTEDKLLDALAANVAKDLKVVTRDTLPGGRGRKLIGDATIGGVKARLGAIALVSNGGAVVGMLAAKTADFDRLGGIELVARILASMKASAPSADASPREAPAGDTAPPAIPITRPVVDTYGYPVVPAPSRAIVVSDLKGGWQNGGGALKVYVNTGTGKSGGFSSAQTTESWTFDGKGNVTSAASYAVVDSTTAKGGHETRTGKATIDSNMVLTIHWNSKDNPVVHYIIRGWVELPDATVARLNGPFYNDGVPPNLIANPTADAYRDSLWARTRAK
ncbi:MAG TPA: hypothetical protein VMJ10_17220 [Kofleriaceae bacterium]|nr:hypothetical protein [Kofleriaceae bacterium]